MTDRMTPPFCSICNRRHPNPAFTNNVVDRKFATGGRYARVKKIAGTVWAVYHPASDEAIAVFSTLEKAEAAYPQTGCQFVQYKVDPGRIFDLENA